MIKRIFRAIAQEILFRRNPVGFFRSQGVKIGEGTIFYGPTRNMFSSEPYLVKIGKGCHITSGVMFIPHDGSPLILRHKYPSIDIVAPIVVGDRVFIGSRTTILAGVRIGSDCIIGAGSVVTKDIPPRSVFAGVPARFIKSLDAYEAQALARSVDTKLMAEDEKKAALLELYAPLLADPVPDENSYVPGGHRPEKRVMEDESIGQWTERN